MVKTLFENPFVPGLELRRYPEATDPTLQAWDSADELLLDHLGGQDLTGKRILIVGDAFGALTSALARFEPQTYTDSFISATAIRRNTKGREVLSRLADLAGTFDLVLMKIPKNMSFFEDILCHLTGHLNPSSQVVCGAMVKHLAGSSFDLLEKYLGPVTTSLARKKARLLFTSFTKAQVPSPYPMRVKIEGFEKEFLHHSNLFSREKLDVGTRFFLEHLPRGTYQTILDLGCANGVVGIKAKLLNPGAKVIFSDESFMAIESAKANYQSFFTDPADFLWTNCYEEQAAESLDLVLCNPPFHQQHTIGDFIAMAMFKDARHSLKKGGLLRVIGNSHLGYQLRMKSVFKNSTVRATNAKFMIVDSIKV